MSTIGRIYADVQSFITQRIEEGKPPTTIDIQKHIFKEDFNEDSRMQKDSVYGAIVRGRDTGLIDMDVYFESDQFSKDLSEVEYYANKLIDEQEKSSDYAEFFTELHMGRFGTETDLIKGNLREFALIAVLWDRKLAEISKGSKNIIIATYGRYSAWRLPSLWRWAIRETDLYLRTLLIVEKQFKRGIRTKVAMLPGTPIQKALGYTESARAALTDGTSWTCECDMINPESANFCSNCGKPKP